MTAEGDGISAVRQDCIKAFEHADEEQKGYLTREDFKVAVLELLGYKPSKYELDSVWSAHVSHGEHECGAATREDLPGMLKDIFLTIMTRRVLQQDQDELIRQVFVRFDAHLNGFITMEDCKLAFHEVAPLIKTDLIESWFREVDSDEDGRVTYRDFELMMKSLVFLTPPTKQSMME